MRNTGIHEDGLPVNYPPEYLRPNKPPPKKPTGFRGGKMIRYRYDATEGEIIQDDDGEWVQFEEVQEWIKKLKKIALGIKVIEPGNNFPKLNKLFEEIYKNV